MRKMRKLSKRRRRRSKDPNSRSLLRSTDAPSSSLSMSLKSKKSKRSVTRRLRKLPLSRLSRMPSLLSKEKGRSVLPQSSAQEPKSKLRLKLNGLKNASNRPLSVLRELPLALSSTDCTRKNLPRRLLRKSHPF
jgi:hypothetical protein